MGNIYNSHMWMNLVMMVKMHEKMNADLPNGIW